MDKSTSLVTIFDRFLTKKPKRRKDGNRAAFIFEYEVDEMDGAIVGIIKDVRLLDYEGKEIRHSSLIYEERSSVGFDAFFDHSDIVVSGLYRWEGTYYARQDYYGEWDCGWDCISLEPADRKTRRAIQTKLQEGNDGHK